MKKQRHYFANKGPFSQSYGFSSSHVWKWVLDYKESWAPKNWCFWTVVLEKTLESPLDCKEIQPVHPKGNQSWIFTGRTDAEVETPLLWPFDVKNWLIGKDPGWERLKAGGEGEDRGWDGWMTSLTRWTCIWVSSRSLQRWHAAVHGVAKSQTWLSDWTELNWFLCWSPVATIKSGIFISPIFTIKLLISLILSVFTLCILAKVTGIFYKIYIL